MIKYVLRNNFIIFILKFFVVAITGYGISTFEGPMLSFKNLNAIGHYTDWIIAHVHVGALAWNGFMAAGIIYWLAAKLWKTELYSKSTRPLPRRLVTSFKT